VTQILAEKFAKIMPLKKGWFHLTTASSIKAAIPCGRADVNGIFQRVVLRDAWRL